jgi:hypothetical protein
MSRWIVVAWVALAVLASPVWAKDNPKLNNSSNNGNAFGQAGDGNPQYKWTPAAASVANNSNRAAEASVDKRSNDVLFGPTGNPHFPDGNPNNVCENPVSAQPGRNPHCAGPSP